jgi:hypothetical protein
MAYDRRRETAAGGGAIPRHADYRRELGPVFVPAGAPKRFTLLDAERARILRGWVDCLIPESATFPAAGAVLAAEYVDANVFRAPALRATLLGAIGSVDARCREHHGVGFADAEPGIRDITLQWFESIDTSGAFAMIRDLTYEAYYADPTVLARLDAETGWRADVAYSGGEMEDSIAIFEHRLPSLEPRWRKV